MASVVDICNQGLDKLGQSPIVSLTPPNPNKASSICNRMWPIARDRTLRAHPWNFAVTRDITAPSTDTPSWGFTYKHALPSDFLRLLEIRDLRKEEYQLEGRHILTNESALYIRYIKRVTNPNEYDALFIDCVAARLTFEMCEAFNQNNTKKSAAWEEYDAALSEAKMIDAVENPQGSYEEDDWISVRY